MEIQETVNGIKYIINNGIYATVNGDIDSPENVVLYVNNNGQKKIDEIEEYQEEIIDFIIDSLWKNGDKILEATDQVAFFITEKNIFVKCFIDLLESKWCKGYCKVLEEKTGFFISIGEVCIGHKAINNYNKFSQPILIM